MPRGRPLTYTSKLGKNICQKLAEGESLRSICRSEGMPPESTVRGWVIDDIEGFAAQYARARDIGLDAIADETFDIADDGRNDWIEREGKRGETYIALNEEAVARSRMRLDQRKWYLSKLAPKKYGEKIQQEMTGPDGAPLPQPLIYLPANGRETP